MCLLKILLVICATISSIQGKTINKEKLFNVTVETEEKEEQVSLWDPLVLIEANEDFECFCLNPNCPFCQFLSDFLEESPQVDTMSELVETRKIHNKTNITQKKRLKDKINLFENASNQTLNEITSVKPQENLSTTSPTKVKNKKSKRRPGKHVQKKKKPKSKKPKKTSLKPQPFHPLTITPNLQFLAIDLNDNNEEKPIQLAYVDPFEKEIDSSAVELETFALKWAEYPSEYYNMRMPILGQENEENYCPCVAFYRR